MAVEKFNEDFKEAEHDEGSMNLPPRLTDQLIQLARNFKNYELRPSKKNGKPKIDLPCISPEVKVIETFITQFSLVFREEDILKIKSKSKKEKGSHCRRCLIF